MSEFRDRTFPLGERMRLGWDQFQWIVYVRTFSNKETGKEQWRPGCYSSGTKDDLLMMIGRCVPTRCKFSEEGIKVLESLPETFAAFKLQKMGIDQK